MNEQGDDDAVTCTGAIHEEELQTDETGAFGFALKLVSELEGVDELLGKGTLRVEKIAARKAWRVRAEIKGEWLWMFVGALSIAFGVLVALEPATGLFAVVYTFAFYALLTGITFIGLSFRLRSAAAAGATRA